MHKIKLVVVDSISYPFRLSVRNVRLRDGLLSYIGHSLVQVAVKHGVAVSISRTCGIKAIIFYLTHTTLDSCNQPCCDRSHQLGFNASARSLLGHLLWCPSISVQKTIAKVKADDKSCTADGT